jgi:hypothetical protein
MDFTDLALTRVDQYIDFIWATGDRGIGEVDFAADVYVGRIPVYADDYTSLDEILQKIIDYETLAPPAWRRSVLTAHVSMGRNDPANSNYQLGEALKADFADPLGYTTYRIYESDFGIIPAPECPAINEKDLDPEAPCNMLGEWVNGNGYGLLTWTTHGIVDRANELIESTDNERLNDGAPAFTFQGSCLNGFPERADNLGYALLQSGAISTVSASRITYSSLFHPDWDPNPQSSKTSNLAYHYSGRIMRDQAAGQALYLTKEKATKGWSSNAMAFNLYGDPSSALFRSIGGIQLLFDTSGSMSWSHEGTQGVPLEEQRLSLAKEAVYPFMEALVAHAHARVNFGISVFPPHPLESTIGCNGQVITPMTLVNEASTTTAVTTTIPGLVAEGNTPLLAGLETAISAFGTERPRAIVLLSDGYQNCPSILGGLDPAVEALIADLKEAEIRVYTISFGRPTDNDHPLLSKLAADTGGGFYDVTMSFFELGDWSPANELAQYYTAILVDALGLETAADPVGIIDGGKTATHEVRINEHDRKVSVLLTWQTRQENRLALRVKTSDGLSIPITAAIPGVSFNQSETYKIVTLHREFLQSAGKVGPDPWVLEIDANGLEQDEQEHYQYSVIVDSNLTLDVTFDKEKYWVGDTIVLQAKLTADRQPITGLNDVRVRISSPEDGIGNWFALNKVTMEELEAIPSKRDGETLSPIQRKAIYLNDVRKIATPGRHAPKELQLYDDGTHSDALAGDGVYTNTIADTGKEGTYAFYIRASGPTTTGNSFDRDVTFHKHLVPKPSVEHVAVTATPTKIDKSNLKRYMLTITPKDALDNYLGPRYASAIALNAEPQVALGPTIDNLDGTYSRMIELPADVKAEEVKILLGIQDAEMSFILADKVEEHAGPNLNPKLLFFLLVILIAVVLGTLRMRRQSRASQVP